MSEDDQRLIASARGGDRAAFGELVRRYQRRVYAAALHITGNHSDADDVAQESFVKAYRHLAGFDGRSDLFTWLYRITVNTALNHLRSRKRADRLVRPSDDPDGPPDTADATQRTPREWVEIAHELRTVIEKVCELSPVLRVTLVLATVEQLPYKEIAAILEVPEGTVAWRVNEARRQLRQEVAAATDAAARADEEIA
ncbi:MAG TPA: sigma-70 family RNA polymerase sigma factor [Kofleriaceae bacterium]|nr:sigma-70 family RNA polymerase sigma factor [Kofleriaceae bacterium]